jgi:hypothetical protein
MTLVERGDGLYGQDTELDQAALSDPTSRALVMLQRGGADPETLGKYMDLQERWEANKSRQAFAEAMTKAQAEMPTVVKDRENTHTRSLYASLETVQRAIKPVYLRNGFTITFSEGEPPRDGWVRVLAQVRHIGGHVETFHRDGPMDNLGPQGKPTKSELHGVASSVTYLTRHLLCGIFGVTVANEDNDGGGVEPTITEEQAIKLGEMFEGFENPDEERSRFLSHFKYDDFRSVPAGRYESAVSAVKKKLGAKR